jgi:hypothetical protein
LAKRVHPIGVGPRAGTSLAVETVAALDEESRLKAGCSQDWLPHKHSVNATRGGASLVDFLLHLGKRQQELRQLLLILIVRYGGLLILQLVDSLFELLLAV